MNNFTAIGRWVREHEMNTSQSGTVIVKNTIAVDHPFKKDSPSFLRVVMFGKTGELANQYTGKGSQIGLQGHIQTGDYTNKEGVKVYTTDVIANSIKFLDSKPTGQQEQPQQNNYQEPQQAVSDDMLPF